jgi:hypothetical protein
MVSGTFFGPVALLYYLCGLLLAALPLFIAWRGGGRPRTGARLRRTYCLLSLFLLLWLLTLFLEVRTALPAAQLWLGRINFAAVVFAASLAVRFVQHVSLPVPNRNPPGSLWLTAETGLLGVLTLFTPLVDAAERVEAGSRAITTFGPLFPVYLAHVVACLGTALFMAFRGGRRADDPKLRQQLDLIGLGMLATGVVAFFTNALLPYVWGEFRFCDVGTLSTLLFVLAIAYATFLHGLFDLRVLLRRTLVYGLLLAFVVGTYRSAVLVLSQYFTAGAGTVMQFAVLLIAFSVDPLRRFLEKKTDHLLFGEQDTERAPRKRRSAKDERTRSHFALVLFFPWRRP